MTLKTKILSFSIKGLGWCLATALTLWLVISKFVKDVPAKRGIAVTGAILLLIVFLIFGRFFNLWLKNKMTAIATTKELNQVGRTNPIVATIMSSVYVMFPFFILILFLYGVQSYAGILWQAVLTLVGTLSLGFIGNVIATFIERAGIQKQALLKSEQDKDDIAERVSKKISIDLK